MYVFIYLFFFFLVIFETVILQNVAKTRLFSSIERRNSVSHFLFLLLLLL